MSLFRTLLPLTAAALAGLLVLPAVDGAQDSKKDKSKDKTRKWANTWTDPEDKTIPVDYRFQGEYKGEGLGCQVIALDKGRFQAVVYPGGLPGDGWDGKNKILMDGKLTENKVIFESAGGKRTYKAKGFETFSATSKFPPVGQKKYGGTIDGETLAIETDDGKSPKLKKVSRKSKTLGRKPPRDAVILFDGSNKDEWIGGRLDESTKFLNTDGNDIRTKKKFNNYSIHLEFMT